MYRQCSEWDIVAFLEWWIDAAGDRVFPATPSAERELRPAVVADLDASALAPGADVALDDLHQCTVGRGS